MKKHLSNKSKNEQGFTIIEVLIVLAIAALILVVVLVAIPQLQRNQRNSARQSDTSRIVTSVQNWSANNNGQVFPNDNTAHQSLVGDLGSLSQYDLDQDSGGGYDAIMVGTGEETSLVSSGSDPAENLDRFRIVTGATCADQGATTDAGVGTRAVAVQYLAETNAGVEGRCVSS